MFNNKSNNGNGINVNTRLFSSFSDTCMLTVTAWNDKISLKFHPIKNVTADGLRQYAQDNVEIVNSTLTPDNAITFLNAVNDVIVPAIKDGKEADFSIRTGVSTNIKVLTVKFDGKDVYISVLSNVNENGVCENPEANTVTHKFNNRDYMLTYDPASGNGVSVEVKSEFIVFISKIEDIKNIGAAVPHSLKYAEAIKAAYSTRGNYVQTTTTNNSGYQAPENTYSGNDIAEVLPWE